MTDLPSIGQTPPAIGKAPASASGKTPASASGPASASAPAPVAVSNLAITLRFALRNLRSGLRGFGIFLGCIALGVAAIAGVGSVARSLSDGLASQGRLILGGDVAASLLQREATPEELAFLKARGQVTSVATMRSMARTQDGRSALVEPKAVDANYPSVGTLVTEPALPPAELFANRNGAFGAVADGALFSRLGLKVGDRVLLGEATLELRAQLESEPDKLAAGINFGPRILLSQDGLRASGLLQPGSLVRWSYRLSLPSNASDDAALTRFTEDLQKTLPDSGFETRSRVNAAPQFQRNIERFAQFLTLVGLAALIVGGVGVANAVAAYVDRRRASMATLKSLGATGGRVFAIALVEIMVIALLGTLIGLAVGATLPYVVSATAGSLLPVPVEPHVYARELAQGALYGLLTALAFALWPLGRAHDVPVSALFRDQVEPDAHWPRKRYMVMVALAVIALAGSAILLSFDRRIAVAAVVGTAGAFVLLRLVAFAITGIAARLPRPRRTELRMAVANIHRPGALTPSLVLSLGLGVTLLVTLAVIDGTIRSQLSRSIPQKAPSFFFLDVPSTEAERFDAFLAKEAPGAKVERVPMMRGRVLAVKGVPAERDQGRRKRRLGAGRRSRHHLFRDRARGLARGRGRMVARRLYGARAGVVRPGAGAGHRPCHRRHHHRQRARALDDRQGRQSQAGRVAVARHQLRHGVLAVHLRRRAAYRPVHPHLPRRGEQ